MRSDRHWNRTPLAQKLAAGAGLAFLNIPVWVIVLYAFTTEDRTYQFPPPGLTLHWFSAAFARDDIWAAMRLSLAVACVATVAALMLGTLAAFALAKRNFPAFLRRIQCSHTHALRVYKCGGKMRAAPYAFRSSRTVPA